MAESENLAILIDVIDQFSRELDRLLFKLGQVEVASQAVDPVTIDVDVDGAWKLDHLLFKLGQLEAADLGGVGDIVLGEKHVRRGGGGGGMGRRGLDKLGRLDLLLTAQVNQMGRFMKEADDLTESMGAVSSASDSASDSFELTNLRMSDLHNALAKLVPLIFVFIGAIPAVIGGLIALGAAAISAAAALAAIGGLGALGFAAMEAGRGNLMEGFQEIVGDIADDFLDAFLPVAERLVPVFRDAMDGLDRLFQQIANRGDVLVRLGDQARAFGEFMLDWLPTALANMGRMAEAFSGMFSVIAGGMRDMSILRELTEFFGRAMPELTAFTSMVIALLPHIFEMSIGFLKVTNVVLGLVNVTLDLLTAFGMLDKGMGLLIGTILAAATAWFIFNSAAIQAALSGLVKLGVAVGMMITHLTGYTASTVMATAATYGLTSAVFALIGVLTLGAGILAAGALFQGLANRASLASDSVKDAAEQLKAFDSVAGGVSDTNPFAHPELRHGSVNRAPGSGGGGDVNVTVEGDADEETTRTQVHNAMYRKERPRRRV